MADTINNNIYPRETSVQSVISYLKTISDRKSWIFLLIGLCIGLISGFKIHQLVTTNSPVFNNYNYNMPSPPPDVPTSIIEKPVLLPPVVQKKYSDLPDIDLTFVPKFIKASTPYSTNAMDQLEKEYLGIKKFFEALICANWLLENAVVDQETKERLRVDVGRISDRLEFNSGMVFNTAIEMGIVKFKLGGDDEILLQTTKGSFVRMLLPQGTEGTVLSQGKEAYRKDYGNPFEYTVRLDDGSEGALNGALLTFKIDIKIE